MIQQKNSAHQFFRLPPIATRTLPEADALSRPSLSGGYAGLDIRVRLPASNTCGQWAGTAPPGAAGHGHYVWNAKGRKAKCKRHSRPIPTASFIFANSTFSFCTSAILKMPTRWFHFASQPFSRCTPNSLILSAAYFSYGRPIFSNCPVHSFQMNHINFSGAPWAAIFLLKGFACSAHNPDINNTVF